MWKASFLIIIGSLIALQSCTPKVTTASSGSYKEDLSKYRPVFEEYVPLTADNNQSGNDSGSTATDIDYPEPTNHIGEEIDQIVQMTIDYNKSKGYFNGYSIQAYSGVELKEANAVDDKLRALGYLPNTKFDSPIYRTKIGKYYTRLEAIKDFNEIKEIFPLTVLVTEKIKIN